jgi:hypothetical protein
MADSDGDSESVDRGEASAARGAGVTLFEHVIRRGGAKHRRCSKAGHPADDDPLNCGKDGYLMAKALRSATQTHTLELGAHIQRLRQSSYDITGIDGATYRLESLLAGAPAAEDRFQRLNRAILPGGGRAMESFMDQLCIIDPDMSPPYVVNFESFGKELAAWTDWFYAEENKGSLFLRYVTPADARAKRLPALTTASLGAPEAEAGGAEAFLYVVLVCAGSGTGFGKSLVAVAERFALTLGLKFVVLSALPHVVGYYHRLGFKFVDHTGHEVDVAPWLGTDDTGRQRLYPDTRA